MTHSSSLGWVRPLLVAIHVGPEAESRPLSFFCCPRECADTIVPMNVKIGSAGIVVGALLAALVMQFARAQGASTSPGARTVWQAVYTQAQADRGQADYTKSCADCHDEDLELPGDDMTSTLAGADFLNNWNGLTAYDLFERIRTTMPIDHPSSLPTRTILDIMAYMFSYNKFPAGKAELPQDTKMLRLITITWKPLN